MSRLTEVNPKQEVHRGNMAPHSCRQLKVPIADAGCRSNRLSRDVSCMIREDQLQHVNLRPYLGGRQAFRRNEKPESGGQLLIDHAACHISKAIAASRPQKPVCLRRARQTILCPIPRFVTIPAFGSPFIKTTQSRSHGQLIQPTITSYAWPLRI